MKTLKIIGISCIALFLIVVVGSQFLPGEYRVERSVAIGAKPEAIFPLLASLKTWPQWTAWSKEEYPQMVWTFSGPESGVGATSEWNDPKTNGRMTITRVSINAGVWYDLSMENDQFQAHGALMLDRAAAGTKVRWVDEGDLGRNPLNRIFGLFLDGMVGKDFEKGLAKLKMQVEAAPAAGQ